ERDVVGRARLDEEAMRVAVHPQRERAVRAPARDREAEHTGGEGLPRSEVADLEAQIPELRDLRRLVMTAGLHDPPTWFAGCPLRGLPSNVSDEIILVLEPEQHAAPVLPRLVGVVGVVGTRRVDVEEEAQDRVAEEDGAAAALREEIV